MSKFKFYLLGLGLSGILFTCQARRSVYRPVDPLMPEIITRWNDDTQEYHLRSPYLEEAALFKKFDPIYFKDHLLPKEKIIYRNNPDKYVNGSHLHELSEQLLEEIYQRKTKFTHFKVLKNNDFNFRTCSGYMILKFNDYPFVLKLSREDPESFVKPFSKGWQPSLFFMMGGSSSYLCGFTRIKNLEIIEERIKADEYWSKLLDTPRKWFWSPSKCRWFELKSKNVGPNGTNSIELPSVYGVIADAIDAEETFSIFNKEHRALALKLAKFLGNRIDAHVDNFMREKSTGIILIVDTEDFRAKVGLRQQLEFDNYPSWYFQLSKKCFTDMFCKSKKSLKEMQSKPSAFLIDTDYNDSNKKKSKKPNKRLLQRGYAKKKPKNKINPTLATVASLI